MVEMEFKANQITASDMDAILSANSSVYGEELNIIGSHIDDAYSEVQKALFNYFEVVNEAANLVAKDYMEMDRLSEESIEMIKNYFGIEVSDEAPENIDIAVKYAMHLVKALGTKCFRRVLAEVENEI